MTLNLDTKEWFDPFEWLPLGLGNFFYVRNSLIEGGKGMYKMNTTGPTIVETINSAYTLLTWAALPNLSEMLNNYL